MDGRVVIIHQQRTSTREAFTIQVNGRGQMKRVLQKDQEVNMIRKIISALVIVSFLGFSTAYAHDPYDDHRDDQTAGIAVVAALAVVTVFVLALAHDRHAGPPPSRHPQHPRPPRHPGHPRHFSQGGTGDTDAAMTEEQVLSLQVARVP
jgi:hypothetical protein